MPTPRYETHQIPNPLLPFIYHRRFEVNRSNKHANWHENIELLQCLEGSGYVMCGTEQIPLTPEALVVVNADTIHSINTDSRVVYRCLIIDNSFFLSNGVPIHALYFRNLIDDEKVLSIINEIAQTYEAASPEDYQYVLSIRAQILNLVRVLCMEHTTGKPENVSNEYVKQAVVYLRQHMAEPFSLEQLAEALGISKFHLAHLFKQHTGKTIVQTLNLIRCSQAQRMMEDGASVSAAALSCGFENLSYFTRTYKKYMGILPSKQLHINGKS